MSALTRVGQESQQVLDNAGIRFRQSLTNQVLRPREEEMLLEQSRIEDLVSGLNESVAERQTRLQRIRSWRCEVVDLHGRLENGEDQ